MQSLNQAHLICMELVHLIRWTTTWVIFENDGRFKEDVQSVFKRFYMEWLPFSGYKYAELPDIEVYPICSGQPVNGHSEVWIAVSKEDD